MNGFLMSTMTPMETIIDAITNVTTLMTTVFNLLVANPLLLFLLAAGLVPIGFEIFRSAKSAAR